MIPLFNESGYLPPGIHPATLDEIDARFGQLSEIRRVQMESIHWMMEIAARAGIERIILNGGFVTDIIEPDDVDCVLLPSLNYPADSEAEEELEAGLPFMDITLAESDEFDLFVKTIFGTDRYLVPKGVVEVIQWT
jgi:hypothetical protein